MANKEILDTGVVNLRTKATSAATHFLGVTGVGVKDEGLPVLEVQKMMSRSGINASALVSGATNLTFGGTTRDWPHEAIELEGDTTLSISFAEPGLFVLVVEQDGTGGWELNFPAGYLGAEPLLQGGAGDKTLYLLFHDGASTFHVNG